MQLKDFEYNGEMLSDYGLMVCSFDGVNDQGEIGNSVAVNMVKAANADRHMSVGASYDDVFSTSIQVCKLACYANDDWVISEPELRQIVRWLNRKSFNKFKPIYDDFTFTDVYYNATFNIQFIKFGGDVVGLDLTVNTDAPYGYMEPVKYNFKFSSTGDKLKVFNSSDEIGYLHCNVTIKCLQAGTLELMNSFDPKNKVVVKNVSNGEVITLLGRERIIKSSVTRASLPNDFNYKFLRMGNTYTETENVFTASLPCEVSISYSPIRKVGLIV